MTGGASLPPSLLQALQLPSPVSEIHHPLLGEKKLRLFIKRDELIHPLIQGNKWRKLKYNLLDALTQQHDTLLSSGGAYSNHLHALAALGQLCQLRTIGVVRGERPPMLGPTLLDLQRFGMELVFVSRQAYREKHTASFIRQLEQQFGRFYLIPEGANNEAGRKGCGELLQELDQDYDVICSEIGSGAMFSALISQDTQSQQRYLGFAVMKNRQLDDEVRHRVQLSGGENTRWQINHDFHFGGFARTTPQLNQFIIDFRREQGIQLEPVYSGKMLYGIFQLAGEDYFAPGSRILAIHGGGLQGLRGFGELYQALSGD